MNGVTHVQVQAQLHYDNGFVVTVSTPLWHKDIRTGDFFSQELIQEILANVGIGLASVIEQQTLRGLHTQVSEAMNQQQGKRKPGYGDRFSLN